MLKIFKISKINMLTILALAALFLFITPVNSQAETKDNSTNSTNNVNLMDYQLAPGVLKILITPTTEPPFQIGVANLKETKSPEESTYYQGIWVINKNTNKIAYPLLLQKFVVQRENGYAVALNKQGQMPYAQNLAPVQTASLTATGTNNAQTPNLIREPEFQLIHTPAGDYNTILIRTYNPATKEGLIQYLAKGLGTIRLEAYHGNKHYVVAQLKEARPLTIAETQIIKNSLPKALDLPQ